MASGGGSYWDDDNRQIVHDGRQILERTSASLARSNQIAIETENIGTQVNVCLIHSPTNRVIQIAFFVS